MQWQTIKARFVSLWGDSSVKTAVSLYLILRILLTVWAVVALRINPLPEEPDGLLRPYFDQPILDDGIAGLLLGPWQRFDTMHYTRIAAQGYATERDSVFPPLYPLGIRVFGELFGGSHAAYMLAAILISNAACLGLFIVVYRLVADEFDESLSTRTLIYLGLFPVGFYLMAPYSESLFILLAITSVWAASKDKFVWAGVLGLLASLTRLTGWVLIVPLAYEFWRRYLGYGSWKIEPISWYRRNITALIMVGFPPLGTVLFIVYRWLVGLPSLPTIYAEYWYQTTGFPGVDMLTALNTMFLGGSARAGEFTLWFDFFVTLLLIGTTIHAFFRFNRPTWGLYSGLLLLFILLPTSEVKPLYSFSRYTLAFVPTFMLMAEYGRNPIVHRIILYVSLALYLYFSGQFVVWGWVA
ncbi:MAG: hypothetical protein DWQ04_34055 [Chloroflexi bacterium]|nr:MAG: hypothetical protein DWQ04_34055 [Chloroflexota bacterium]